MTTTKFFVKWHVVNARLHDDSKQGAVERQSPLKMLQAASNDPRNPIEDWGCFCSGKDGYLIIQSPDVAGVFDRLLPFMPSLEFDEYSVLLDVNDALATGAVTALEY
jgi:hypothetical protein